MSNALNNKEIDLEKDAASLAAEDLYREIQDLNVFVEQNGLFSDDDKFAVL